MLQRRCEASSIEIDLNRMTISAFDILFVHTNFHLIDSASEWHSESFYKSNRNWIISIKFIIFCHHRRRRFFHSTNWIANGIHIKGISIGINKKTGESWHTQKKHNIHISTRAANVATTFTKWEMCSQCSAKQTLGNVVVPLIFSAIIY